MGSKKISDTEKEELKELLSGRMSNDKLKKHLDSEYTLRRMNKQWNNCGEEPAHSVVKRRIWRHIESECFDVEHNSFLRRYALGIAVSIAVVVAIAGFWFVSMHTAETFIEVTAQQNKLYTLPDSSKIWMQKGSKIRYSNRFNENRKVWLAGNSLFNVRHKQSNQPFCVYINDANIEVKGTTFLVKQTHAEKCEVILFNGRIELNLDKTHNKIVMHPSENVLYNSLTGKAILQQIPGIAFKEGRYHFTDVPLSQLVAFINQMSDTAVKLGDGVPADELFTGSIGCNESVNDLADNICFVLDLYKKVDNHTITIKKRE